MKIPSQWMEVLQDHLTVEYVSSHPSLTIPGAFGWLGVVLPIPSSLCWHLDLLDCLREGLVLLALVSTIDRTIWREFPCLDSYHQDELELCYRFHTKNSLTDVATLLDQRHAYSSSFQQAKNRILQSSGLPRMTVRIPIALIVQPSQWYPTRLNEIAALCKLHKTHCPSDPIVYEITSVELDLLDMVFADTTVFALIRFLQSDAPVTALGVRIDDTWWTRDTIQLLIKTVDRPSTVSLKLAVRSSVHYGEVMTALSRTQYLKSVEIDGSQLNPSDLNSAITPLSGTNIKMLRWSSHDNIIPPPFRSVEALGLAMDETSQWVNTLFAMGPQLRGLQLYGRKMSGAMTISIQRILEACPRLMYLGLWDVTIDSLDPLIDSYPSGGCGVRSLELERVEIIKIDSVSRLALELQNSNSSIAQALFEFSWIPNGGIVPTKILNLFADALDWNPRVRLLRLGSSSNTQAITRLWRHQYKPLLAYDHPFLDVVNHGQNAVSALTRLSDDVIGHIFSFADICERRAIRLLHEEDPTT